MKTKVAVLAACLLASASAFACSVPVYRYALERWPAEIYAVVVAHKGPLTGDDKKTVDWMKACSADGNVPSNVAVEDIDVDKPPAGMEPERLAALKAKVASDGSVIIVSWPDAYEKKEDVWSGPLSRANATAVLDSPARREIAKQILSGDVCVWVVIASGDKEADDAMEKLVREQVVALAKTLELPEIDPADVQEGTPKPDLKVALSSLRISRTDPAEKVFAAMLLGADHSVPADKPGLATIFGQGRLLCTLAAEDVKPEVLGRIGQFLCGSCSCIVKDQNPGIDLLMSVNWSQLPDAKWVKPQDPPPLTGLGTAAQTGKAPGATREPKPWTPPNTYVLGPVLFLTVAGIVVLAAIVVLVILFARRPESR